MRPLVRLGPNEVFGWYTALTGAPASEIAIAATDSCVWVMPKESLDGLLRGSTGYVQGSIADCAVARPSII